MQWVVYFAVKSYQIVAVQGQFGILEFVITDKNTSIEYALKKVNFCTPNVPIKNLTFFSRSIEKNTSFQKSSRIFIKMTFF